MDNWKRMTADDYAIADMWRQDNLTHPYPGLVVLLGEPHKNGEDDFPDDDWRVDVCWGFQRGEDRIFIWNYKNGPVYTGAPIEDVYSFSVSYTSPEAWRAFQLEKLLGLTCDLSEEGRQLVKDVTGHDPENAPLVKPQPASVKAGPMDI